jgi:hypothetical protein
LLGFRLRGWRQAAAGRTTGDDWGRRRGQRRLDEQREHDGYDRRRAAQGLTEASAGPLKLITGLGHGVRALACRLSTACLNMACLNMACLNMAWLNTEGAEPVSREGSSVGAGIRRPPVIGYSLLAAGLLAAGLLAAGLLRELLGERPRLWLRLILGRLLGRHLGRRLGS